MFELVDKAICDHKMLDGKNRLIVALSGGADSMSLLHYFCKNADRLKLEVAAAHLNHSLRGEESERDCEFVKRQCERLGVRLFVRKLDIAELSKQRKIGLEECGRQERYQFFEELAFQKDSVVATAHTASDNVETVLLNITRGCGISGLTGIPPVRGKIIRPLIYLSRADIEEYCRENDIEFVTDSTNLSDDYSRNKIRLNVIPQLSLINPSVESSINRLSQIAEDFARFSHNAAENEYNRCFDSHGLLIDKLRECDDALLSMVLKYAVEKRFHIVPEKKHIDIIKKTISNGSGGIEIKKSCTALVSDGYLTFLDTTTDKALPKFEPLVPMLGSEYIFNGKKYLFSELDKVDDGKIRKINKKLLNERLCCGTIHDGVVLRTRQAGDFFKPFGRNCTKKVKKLFTELKIPRPDRDTMLMLADGHNVLWIEGIGVSEDSAAKCGEDSFVIEVEHIGK